VEGAVKNAEEFAWSLTDVWYGGTQQVLPGEAISLTYDRGSKREGRNAFLEKLNKLTFEKKWLP
jgi:1,4-dihydroxy-2-naphthoyl-CoA synthase